MCSILILGRTILEQPDFIEEDTDESYAVQPVEPSAHEVEPYMTQQGQSDKKNIKDLLDNLNIHSDIPIMVYFYDILGGNSKKKQSNIVYHDVSGTFLNIGDRINTDIDYIIQDYSVPITTEEWKSIINFANKRNVKKIIARGGYIEASMKSMCKLKLLQSLHKDLKHNIVNQSEWFSIQLVFGKTRVNLKVFPELRFKNIMGLLMYMQKYPFSNQNMQTPKFMSAGKYYDVEQTFKKNGVRRNETVHYISPINLDSEKSNVNYHVYKHARECGWKLRRIERLHPLYHRFETLNSHIVFLMG